jgi:pSer/pThr/pTyr-binding forkhead associated (FHA) protein
LTESLSLHLVDTGEIIPTAEKKEFVIGRNSEGQTNIPDIDLTPYDAYTAGVSRTHVYIKMDQSGFTVRDLGSANGTRLNGHRIAAHTENKIKHGDILTLGTLKVQVFIQE